MNLREARNVIKVLATETHLIPFLWGHGGEGKSETVVEAAQELARETGKDWGVIDYRVGEEETGDIVGLPSRGTDGVVHYDRNPLFPTAHDIGRHLEVVKICHPDGTITEGGPIPAQGLLVYDEVNRGMGATVQALYQVMLTQVLHDHRLAEGWRMVMAGNPSTADYFVNPLDDAFLSRVVQIFVENNIDQWALYARAHNFPEDVVEFLRTQPALLRGHTDQPKMTVRPSPRSWAQAAEVVQSSLRHHKALLTEVLGGIVGDDAANALATFMDQRHAERPLTAEEVLTDYPTHRERFQRIVASQRADLRDATISDVLTVVIDETEENPLHSVENLHQWMLDLPIDLMTAALTRLMQDGNDTKSYLARQMLIEDEELSNSFYMEYMARREQLEQHRQELIDAGLEDSTLKSAEQKSFT